MFFKPEYDAEVFIVGPTRIQHMNPELYATMLSAHQLVDLLADLRPTIVMASPIPLALGTHFTPSKLVPFLKFPSGYTESAGSIQKWWDRLPEPENKGLALRFCKAQIAADEAAWLREQQDAQ